MKKNLLSVLILALLIVNIVLTAIMMISVTSTNKKTAAVIGDIATILNLELEKGSESGEGDEAEISIKDTTVYNIEDKMTIPLRVGEDGKQHYAIVSVSLAMNNKHDDYKTYGETIKEQESLIKGEINEAFSSYSMEDLQVDPDVVREDILKRVQKLFDSDFIYKVTFRDMTKQ